MSVWIGLPGNSARKSGGLPSRQGVDVPWKTFEMPSQSMTVRVTFSPSEVTLSHGLYGTKIRLQGASATQAPGAPGVPIRVVEIAIPDGLEVANVTARVKRRERLTHTATLVAPMHEPGQLHAVNLREGGAASGERSGRWVMPDVALYEAEFRDMQERTAWLLSTWVEGHVSIAGIAVRPVRLDAFGRLELVTELDVVLALRPAVKAHPRLKRAAERHEWSWRKSAFAGNRVLNREWVEGLHETRAAANVAAIDPSRGGIPATPEHDAVMEPMDGSVPVTVPRFVDYLIITDDTSWDASAISAGPSVGDLPASFQRLADWKAGRGLRTHLARISHIVDGSYGDFKTGARDLQEVLRNFLKWFVWHQDTDFVLLGGGIDVVPVREACGCRSMGYFGLASAGNGLLPNSALWKGAFLGMQIAWSNGAPWVGNAASDTLTIAKTGEIVPYDAAGPNGTSSPRWYHTTDDTFSTFTPMQTDFVRVDGDAGVINGPVQWYTYVNLIPTDLYYASLYASTYDQPGKHDWDLTGNGLYGQWYGADNLDGVDHWDDVLVGRAPVLTSAEADVFVDKVIAYEQSADRPEEMGRFNRMLIAAEHLGDIYGQGNILRAAGDAMPPDAQQYAYDAVKGRAVVHAPIAGKGFSIKLLSKAMPGDYRLIPYDPDAGAGRRGWHFLKDSAATEPNVIQVNLISVNGEPFRLPRPSEWIAVYSNDVDELTPERFLIDEEGLDISIEVQEKLRELMAARSPGINDIRRLYSHEHDLPVESAMLPTLRELSVENIRFELNQGPHLVSLSGHGWYGGCCQVDFDHVVDLLTNGNRTSIVYADSCYTNEFNKAEAISRQFLIKSGGGAVAYIGLSRAGWQGHSSDFQLDFFDQICGFWANYHRHLGFSLGFARGRQVAHHPESDQHRWTRLALNLMGDPEMPVVRDEADLRRRYVGNTRTMELHERNCPWVGKMWVGNMLFLEEKDWALNHGYDGCAFCLREHHTH